MGDINSAINGGNSRPPARKNSLVADTWSTRHETAVLLRSTGHTNDEIAEKLDYSPSYISRILKDPRAVSLLEELKLRITDNTIDIGSKLELLANESVETVAKVMRKSMEVFEEEGDDYANPVIGALASRSAFGILDRAGYGKVEKRLVAHANISDDKLDKMLDMAKDAKQVQDTHNYAREIIVESDGDDSGGDSS